MTTAIEANITALCQRSRDISLEKGWLNPDGTDPRPFYTVTGLFHTELSEAFEDIRSNKKLNELYYEATLKGADGTLDGNAEADQKVTLRSGELLGKSFVGMPKPCGIPVELADFVIRVCQYYGSAGQGEKFAAVLANIPNLTIADRLIPENGEQLIAQLHADVSMAFIMSTSNHPVGNPMHHLATAVYWTFHFCEKNDIPLWDAISMKEAYNRTRPQKHGGKKM